MRQRRHWCQGSKEFPDRAHEPLELIVVKPVARVLEFDNLGSGEMVQPAIAFGIRSPAVCTVE